ncbi:MAG: CDP-2,3-bis-(O-geranylgeranyl)-sn-glycerol synthase [Candidatus Micrarchaeia archaeon]
MIAQAIYSFILYPIIFILPAYVANGAPVVFGSGKPLDFGKSIKGKRIFGDHKTIRGLVAGLLSGFVVAAVESAFLPFMLVTGILLAFGTHVGDLLGSFIKRRMGVKAGASVPLMDQYLFFLVALLFALPAGHLPGAIGLLFLVLLTGLLHLYTNRVAYLLKLKKVPW